MNNKANKKEKKKVYAIYIERDKLKLVSQLKFGM
jgi:hypothetical protein